MLSDLHSVIVEDLNSEHLADVETHSTGVSELMLRETMHRMAIWAFVQLILQTGSLSACKELY